MHDLDHLLTEIAREAALAPPHGEVASYIPELATVRPDQFGMAVRRVDGAEHVVGDADVAFSVQSIAKVLMLSLAMRLHRERGLDAAAISSRVGVEPSGSSFNSLIQLEHEAGIPRNPLINAGALVISDLLISLLDDPREAFVAFVRQAADDPSIDIDDGVATSELRTSFRNRALIEFMKAFGNIRHGVDEVLSFYVQACALAMSCRQVARAYSYLAAAGTGCSGDAMLCTTDVRRVNALMLTCGFYDEAGEFAFQVGLPGKSGVGGGIVAVCPGRFTVTAWSPRLGPKGNSEQAKRALQRFAELTGASVF